MQDLLAKIIAMDEKARKMQDKQKLHKIESEKEIEQLRESIYNDYIERAKIQIDQNIAEDQAAADQELEAYRKSTEQAKADMQARFDECHDEWVKTIVDRVLTQ